MKDSRTKGRRAVLLCCIAVLLVPLSVHSQDSGTAAGSKESMRQQAGKWVAEPGATTRDMRMHKSLESMLAQNVNLSALSIATDVENGRAYLRGEVRTGAERQLAGELAKNVDGIIEVQNDLVVRSAEPATGDRLSRRVSDAALTAQVKSRLMLSNNTSGLAIDIHTENNVVTLDGVVGSDTERELAELIAGNTRGVSAVRNKLDVRPD